MAKLVSLIALFACMTMPTGKAFCELEESPPPPIPLIVANPGPFKLAVLIDLSGSMKRTPIPLPKPEAFSGIIKTLRHHGGEIGVTHVAEHARDQMIRVRIDTPPITPPKPGVDTIKNAFERARLLRPYKKDLARYNEVMQKYTAVADVRVAAFEEQLAAFLSQKRNRPQTDLTAALKRASVFLSEPPIHWPQPLYRYLLVISDGLHDGPNHPNPQKAAITFDPDVQVYVVNGHVNLHDLTYLNPIRFEALASCFHFLSHAQGGIK